MSRTTYQKCRTIMATFVNLMLKLTGLYLKHHVTSFERGTSNFFGRFKHKMSKTPFETPRATFLNGRGIIRYPLQTTGGPSLVLTAYKGPVASPLFVSFFPTLRAS
uniref:Uncharacterized protein n=1 Tax=Cacopsylla melanoneura TaxID=428564 RepID=A0A8D8QZR5_9HEMI